MYNFTVSADATTDTAANANPAATNSNSAVAGSTEALVAQELCRRKYQYD